MSKRSRTDSEAVSPSTDIVKEMNRDLHGWKGKALFHYSMNLITLREYSELNHGRLLNQLVDKWFYQQYGDLKLPMLFAGYNAIKKAGGHVNKGEKSFFVMGSPITEDDGPRGYHRLGYVPKHHVYHYHQCTFPKDSFVHRNYAAALAHPFEKKNAPDWSIYKYTPSFDDPLRKIAHMTSLHRLWVLACSDSITPKQEEEKAALVEFLSLGHTGPVPWQLLDDSTKEDSVINAHVKKRVCVGVDARTDVRYNRKTDTLYFPPKSTFRTRDAYYASLFATIGLGIFPHPLTGFMWARYFCNKLGIKYRPCAFHKKFSRQNWKAREVYEAKEAVLETVRF